MGINDIYNESYLNSLCIGLDLYTAKNRLLRIIPDLEPEDIDITFVETDAECFKVLSCACNPIQKKIMLTVSSYNALRHLPSNYQNNIFLRNFLMIFQHIYNDTAVTLNNMHELFRPMKCPSSFLTVLAQWFGVHLDTLGGEDEVRRFLQYAIPLFRFRGTAIGLRMYLAIVSGVVPQILEGVLPYASLEISDTSETEASLFDEPLGTGFFTVYFPVERSVFDDALVRRLSLIVRQEKPVHTKCFIGFKKPAGKKRHTTVISSDTVMGTESGISL